MDRSNKRKLILLCSLFFFCIRVFAEGLQEHTKIWLNAQITGPISNNKKWNYYFDPQLRFIDDKYKFNALNLYAAIYYEATPTMSLWLGVFRQNQKSTSGDISHQSRLWEQVMCDAIKKDAGNLLVRTRLEQRKQSNESQISNRLREKITLQFPIGACKKYHLVLADEMFFQLNKTDWDNTNKTFSQNRASIGIKTFVNKRISYEIGYLNQFEYGSPNEMNHVMFFSVNLRQA